MVSKILLIIEVILGVMPSKNLLRKKMSNGFYSFVPFWHDNTRLILTDRFVFIQSVDFALKSF